MEKTVSKKGTVILGGLTMIGAQATNDKPNLVVVIALAVVLTVYVCVQGYLDSRGKDSPGG